MYTVYFDTSFYVKLCRADNMLSDQTIAALNNLEIRHVLSSVVIGELLTSKHRSDLDRILINRISQFNLKPYRTRDDLVWEILLIPEPFRTFLADFTRFFHDEMAKATSLAIMARQKTSPEQTAELLNANKSILNLCGFPDDFENNMPQVLSASKALLESLGINNLDFPDDPTPANLFKLSEQIKGTLDSTLVAQLEEEYRIQDSATKLEDRPYQVAIGSASNRTAKGLSNTLRDTEHMSLFVNHRNHVDFLQVDTPQENMIKRSKPKHRLAELGLSDHCFSANSLTEAVEKISILIEKSICNN